MCIAVEQDVIKGWVHAKCETLVDASCSILNDITFKVMKGNVGCANV